jgi:hypothetical protein
MKRLLLLVLVAMMAAPAFAADVTTLAPTNTVDWNLWILSGMLGLVLFLFSLRASAIVAENELDIIVSFMAWPAIAYCALASFHVSRVIAVGIVTVYALPEIGVLMFIFLIVAVFNTLRLFAAHSVLKGEQQQRGMRNE